MSAKAGWDQGVAANKGSGDSRDMTVFGQPSLMKDRMWQPSRTGHHTTIGRHRW